MSEKEKCEYCGEFPGSVKIMDPNISDEINLNYWMVCPTCEKIIKQQQKLSLGQMLKHMGKEHGLDISSADKLIKEAEEEIERLSYESGLESFTMEIKKEDIDEEDE